MFNFFDVKNLDLIALIENASELFRLRKYRSKRIVEDYLGLGIHRSNFIGVMEKTTGDVSFLDYRKTVFNSSEDIIIVVEGPVTLPNTPVNNGSGSIVYKGNGIVYVSETVVYNGRLDYKIGVANGIAPLGGDSIVPSAYLPSTVLEQVKLSTYTITAADVTNGYITANTKEILELILGRMGSFQDSGYTINSPADGNITIDGMYDGEVIFLIYKI